MHSDEIAPVSGPIWRLHQALAVLLLMALALSPTATLAREATLPADQGSVSRLIPIATESTTVISAVGEPILRIQCPAGYTATIYAGGLSSPDGLAFSPSGMLHVAEETAGRVSRIESDGSVTQVITGLANPEGIAFDNTGNLYVVEDVQGGRLVKMATDGMTTTLATDLDAPEGVTWASDGTIYVTESNVQFTPPPPPNYYQTRVTAISPLGEVTRILTDTLYWSYAGITIGSDGLLYVTNEASGVGTHDSVFTVGPAIPMTRTLFASNLVAPEGLRFASNGEFPLYVAEEDTGGDNGRLSRVEANGSHMPFCTGFYSIEDVIQDEDGRLYVSEDGSGSIIVIEADAPQRKVYLPLIFKNR